MVLFFRFRVCVPVAAGLISLLFVTAPSAASEPDTSERNIAEIQERALQGSIPQEFELAEAYFDGRGVPQDFERAAYWFEKAAKAGSPEAENQIGYLYQRGIGVRMDQQRAVHWYQLSSASGLAWGKVNLAVCYLNGYGVSKDRATARKLLLEALEKGEGVAAAYLGGMEMSGKDGPVNVTAAERWYETGARLHDPISTYAWAVSYITPEEHPRDLRRGAELLRASARKGYVLAIHALGALLVNHPEMPQRDGEARALLNRASSAGNWQSSAILAILARDGRGTPMDPAVAAYYFHLAGLQGGAPIQKKVAPDLRALSHRISSEAMSESADRAHSWFRQHSAALPFARDGEGGGRLSSSGLMGDSAKY